MLSSSELFSRSEKLYQLMDTCILCPRMCMAKRNSGKYGICGGSLNPSVSAYLAHHGEEPPFSGSQGSGTVFFCGCNLGCIFCQNHQISRKNAVISSEISVENLADYYISLQNRGCHNLNLVTASHYAPQVVKALALAVDKGFSLPVIWNSSGYENLELINLLEGVVDIWLPDMKYMDSKAAVFASNAFDYPEIAKAAISRMFELGGPMVLDNNGIAQSGLCVRHLVLPENLSGSFDFIEWYTPFLEKGAALSLMSQYNPPPNMPAPLDRPLTTDEYYPVAFELKLLNPQYAFIQELTSAEIFNPDFTCNNDDVFKII